MKYVIDKSKIVPGLVVHTPSFEKMQAICECTTDSATPKLEYFKDHKEETCVAIINKDCWLYSSIDNEECEGRKITPFEELLTKDSSITDTPLYLDRKPQVDDYVHKKQECFDNPYVKKHFTDKNGLVAVKVLRIHSSGYVLNLQKFGNFVVNKFNVITPNHPSHPEYKSIVDYTNDPLHRYNPHKDEPIVALSANQIQSKEELMNNTTLKLLLTLMGVTTEAIKDATNSNYIGIITDADKQYVGYVYADTIKQLKEIVAKPENEGNTIHCFKFQDSFKQATRPVVKVTRETEVKTEEE